MNFQIEGLTDADAAANLPIYDKDSADAKTILSNYLHQIVEKAQYRGPKTPAIQFNQFIDLAKKQGITLDGKKVIDFGCGEPRPFGAAIFHYLAGASQILSVDLDPIRDQAGVATAVAGTVIAALFNHLGINFADLGVTNETVRARAATFDLEKLYANDLQGGIPNAFLLRQSRYQALPKLDREFDVLVANSVFEHVDDLADCLISFRENIRPGGYIYSAIDYKDHRIYNGSAKSRWQYMIDNSDVSPGYINRIRHTEFLELIDKSGLQVVDCFREIDIPSSAEREAFLPQYRGMSDIDLTTTGARVLLKAI